MAKIGRPTKYSDEIAEEICTRIANGESLLHITRDDDRMPERTNVHRWLLRHDDFRNKYEIAKEQQADVFADEMDEIARDGSIDVNRARLIIDTRKWVSSKLKPKKYGDKIDHTTNGKDLPTPILGGYTPTE